MPLTPPYFFKHSLDEPDTVSSGGPFPSLLFFFSRSSNGLEGSQAHVPFFFCRVDVITSCFSNMTVRGKDGSDFSPSVPPSVPPELY